MSDLYICRTDEQKAAKQAFDSMLANQSVADAAYDALPDSDSGRVISTDLVRELDASYTNRDASGRRDLAPSWEKAWVYAQDRFAREISKPGAGKIVRFMAGGWAAGKTRVVRYVATLGKTPVTITWDGTLKDTPWARRQIRASLANGWQVDVLYVHRNIELALYGAIERGRSEGRFVPLKELPTNHREVQRSVRRLITDFGPNANVSFSFFHNIGSTSLARIPMTFNEDELAPTGAIHYRVSHERYYRNATEEIEAVCGC